MSWRVGKGEGDEEVMGLNVFCDFEIFPNPNRIFVINIKNLKMSIHLYPYY